MTKTKTKTKTKKPTKKPTKYHYFFHYRRGDYFEISRSKLFSRYLYGSGIGCGGFDVHIYCTPKEYKRIVACARRRWGKIHEISRYTEEALYGDD